ncbi:MAG: chemotaxis protein CheW [Vicinamibacterales bacterium]
MKSSRDMSVLFRLERQLYALPAMSVTEMVSLASVHAVPQQASYMRGLLNLRGRVLPVVDLRLRLGMTSATAELESLIEIFNAREQDHKNWIAELEASILERRPFGLTTDPTKCAFGRWYAGLKTDDLVLETYLKRIDLPHRQIHRAGAEALERQQSGDYEGASAIARNIRENALRETLALMEDARQALREAHKQLGIVVQAAVGAFTVTVDAVESVEQLRDREDDTTEQALLGSSEPNLMRVRRRMKDDTLVLEIDPSLIAGADQIRVPA